MIKGLKICGVSDSKTLNFIVNHPYPATLIGFICNYKASPRYVEIDKLKELLKINKRQSKYVAVIVKNDAVTRILEKEKSLGADIQIQDIFGEVAGVYPKIMQEGTMDAGAWSCGMVAGLIHDIPTCKELIDRVISEAEEIINNRLSKLKTA